MFKAIRAAVLCAALPLFGCGTGTPAMAEAVRAGIPFNPASCDSVKAIEGFAADANKDAGATVVELLYLVENDNAESGVKAQRAVQAYNTVFSADYAASGVLVMHVLTKDNYLVGVIVDGKACMAHVLTADEFHAFYKLATDPTA